MKAGSPEVGGKSFGADARIIRPAQNVTELHHSRMAVIGGFGPANDAEIDDVASVVTICGGPKARLGLMWSVKCLLRMARNWK